MIKTAKHLAYELKVELSELDHIIKNIDSFYYQKETIKKNDKFTDKSKNDPQGIKNWFLQNK